MNKIIILVLLIVLVGGCSTHRKLERRQSASTSDRSMFHSSTASARRIDSMEASVRKQVKERSETGTTVIERGNPDGDVKPFTITAAFTIDTSAKGDTLRLVSQENDQVNFQVYYDKRSGQAVAQVQGKGGKTKTTPFEKITITNATVTKNTDSTGHVKSGSLSNLQVSASDSIIARSSSMATIESSELTRKQTGISNIVWGIFGVVAAAAILLFIFRKAIF